MSYVPPNPNGQATMANSSPVVIASDQSVVPVGGAIASGSADSGNPVKVGGKFNTTLPTYSDGQRTELQFGSRGALEIQIMGAGSTTGAAASASGADTVSNSTAGINIYTFPRTFNGTDWDRARSVINATNSTGTGISAVGILAQFDDSSPTSITENQFGNLRMSANRNLYDTIRDAAGNERGLNVTAENSAQVAVTPTTTGGLSVFNATSSDGATALTNSAQAIKASAGQLYGWYIYNPNATAQFVQLYNTAAASVTVGTTNPLFMLTIPAVSAANVEYTNGITFNNAGWSAAATATAGGNGAPTTALDAVFMYK